MSTEPVEVFDQEDINKNKTMAGLAYFIFFLPLILCPDSRFAKYHANQGLILLICSVAGSIVLSLFPTTGSLWRIFWTLRNLFSLACLALGVMGFLNAYNGKAQELPYIGKYTLLK